MNETSLEKKKKLECLAARPSGAKATTGAKSSLTNKCFWHDFQPKAFLSVVYRAQIDAVSVVKYIGDILNSSLYTILKPV
jgi:hypothetical protein